MLRIKTKGTIIIGLIILTGIIGLIFCYIFRFDVQQKPMKRVQAAKKVATPAKEELSSFSLEYKEAPEDNPLKGFAGFIGTFEYTDFPSSMEFILVPMGSIVKGEKQYDWTALEKELTKVTSYGRQAIVSFYLDYPGTTNGIPQYLLDAGLKTFAYDKYGAGAGGISPDYSDPVLWEMILDFVKALGEKYDGDCRIADIEASIVGIWGEWHTHPYTEFGLEQADILKLAKAYDQHFQYTQVSFRYPFQGMKGLRGGYSDYSFCYETIIDEWSQLNRLKNVGVEDTWKTYMCGGELYPKYRDSIFETENWCLKEGESFDECLDKLHISWLLVGNLGTFTMEEREEAVKASKKLGYEFYINEVRYDPYLEGSIKNMTVSVDIQNLGTAPIYYDWPTTIQVINEENKVVKTITTDWDIRKIVNDGKSHTFTATIPLNGLKKGVYRFGLRIKNPLSNGNPIRFANETQHVDGLMMLGQFGYRTVQRLPYILKRTDYNAKLNEKYGWTISTSYLNDQIPCGETYTYGLRFRRHTHAKSSPDYDMKILLYKDGKRVKCLNTTWNFSKISEDTVYLAWQSADLERGEYVMKLQAAKDIGAIEFGKLTVK